MQPSPPAVAPRAAPGPRRAAGGSEALYAFLPWTLWRFMSAQPPSFWFLNAYIFFEYIRPQSIYPWLEGPPWAQMTLLLCLAAFVAEGNPLRLNTPADASLLLFTAILTLSSVLAFRPEVSYATIVEYFTWVLVYLLIANIVVTERRFLVFLLAFLVYSFKMAQHATRDWASSGFVFRDWGVTGGPGWFQNSGEYGVQMTMYIPIVCYFIFALKRHWGLLTTLFFVSMPVCAVIGTIGSSSRGAMLGVAMAALFMLLQTRHKVKGVVLLSLLALVTRFLLPAESLARFESIGEDDTSVSRKLYWALGLKIMSSFPILGIGYSNWKVYTRSLGMHVSLPHNIFIQAGAELGYTGLLALLCMIAASFVVNRRTRALMAPLGERGRFISASAQGLDAALIGYLVSGFFVTVLYYPFFWVNLAMTVALHRAAGRLRAEHGAAALRSARPAVDRRTALPGGHLS